jgi:hypothetical protein
MPFMADHYLGPIELQGTERERDGLADFDARLFLDPALAESETASVMEQADFLRYLGPSPRPLKGIHAALGFGSSAIGEEATMIAVPDALHRGWSQTKPYPKLPDVESTPLPRPAWWHFLECSPAPKVPLAREPDTSQFLDCSIRVVRRPELSVSNTGPGQAETHLLIWTSLGAGATYILEEATHPDFADAGTIYTGTEESITVYGRSPGIYYYRVRAEEGGNTSDWSNGVPVQISATPPRQQVPVRDYSPETLLAVQRSLLRMCAARGDLFGVLALPEHYREDAAIAHVSSLRASRISGQLTGGATVNPLGYGEATDLSYAAIYHPWLIGWDTDRKNTLRRAPPDGAACGILARRALSRGAWIAPANETMEGVVALTPAIKPERRLDLQDRQINLVRQEPRGFLALSADTLGDDPDLRPINVRRLMILLRRLALRLGATYVFEPNDESLASQVERGFEALLSDLFVRGAFKGATPAESYQVVTGSSLNTSRSRDEGRFLVELRVAPSLPMTFLTIRLVQTGDRIAVAEGR